jgi:hypothetical protein
VPSSPKVNKQKALERKMTGRDANFLGNGFIRDAAQAFGKGLEMGRKGAADVYSKSRTGNPMEVANKYGQQFASQTAKNVVNDVQGLAKMVMKGFGN